MQFIRKRFNQPVYKWRISMLGTNVQKLTVCDLPRRYIYCTVNLSNDSKTITPEKFTCNHQSKLHHCFCLSIANLSPCQESIKVNLFLWWSQDYICLYGDCNVASVRWLQGCVCPMTARSCLSDDCKLCLFDDCKVVSVRWLQGCVCPMTAILRLSNDCKIVSVRWLQGCVCPMTAMLRLSNDCKIVSVRWLQGCVCLFDDSMQRVCTMMTGCACQTTARLNLSEDCKVVSVRWLQKPWTKTEVHSSIIFFRLSTYLPDIISNLTTDEVRRKFWVFLY